MPGSGPRSAKATLRLSMALSDMKVFNEYFKSATIETLAQDVVKFNAASAGSIQLTNQGIDGDSF